MIIFTHTPFLPPPPKLRPRSPFRSNSVAVLKDSDHKTNFIDFPHASAPVKDLMLGLVSSLETRVGPSLLPCSLSPDVQSFENPAQSAQARLTLRPGAPDSPVDFVLGSWIHCKLPSGALNIASISTYLKPSTNAPNFFIDIIQGSPKTLIMVLDMPPRKDLVMNPDYLKKFYEDPELDRHRKTLEEVLVLKPYIPAFLYIRAFISPVALFTRLEDDDAESAEEIIRARLKPAAQEMMNVWLDFCAVNDGNRVDEDEMAYLRRRDRLTRTKSFQIDLERSLPQMFGNEAAGRALRALRQSFGIS